MNQRLRPDFKKTVLKIGVEQSCGANETPIALGELGQGWGNITAPAEWRSLLV